MSNSIYPEITNIVEKNEILTFNLSKTNVSFVNALRRTILSDIPIACCITSPYEKNKCNITTNTTRLNNEILKQRLSCIPIYISDLETGIGNLQLELKELEDQVSESKAKITAMKSEIARNEGKITSILKLVATA